MKTGSISAGFFLAKNTAHQLPRPNRAPRPENTRESTQSGVAIWWAVWWALLSPSPCLVVAQRYYMSSVDISWAIRITGGKKLV